MSEPFGSNPVPGKYKQYRDPIMDGLELRHLVEGGDIPDLKKADNTDVQNLTLHQCAREGDVESITLLMNHLAGTLKKKINLHDEDELSPIHYAARYNNLEVVKLLVENGADVNDEGEEKDTPLHYAARYRSERKKKEPKGDDALLEPAANGGMPVSESIDDIDNFMNNTVVGYLISKGAKPNAEDKYGQTALHFAAMRGNEVAAGGLLSLRGKVNVDLEAVDKQRLTPLHVACIHNQLEIVRMLIDAGANLRCTTQEQSTPLHLACAEGHIPVVELLFEAAAKQTGWVTISDMVTDKDSTEYTCLHHAVDNGHYEITRMCIDKKADVNTPTASYAHPLHLAAAAGDIRIVRMLLDNHARIDALNDDQATALHKAAMYNHVEVVELLVKRGARIDRRDVDDFTPLLLAAVYGHKETLELLIRMGADFRVAEKSDKTALYLAAEENKYEALETLLSYPDIKSLINQGDRYDSEPLHIAAQNGFLEVCKLLLDNEADIDSKNEEEQTPLHLAAIHGRTQIVREIVSRDKRAINDEDESSNTPLHLAALYGNAKAVEALIKMGADVEARNYSLWTPLDCAASKGWVKTSRVLLENDAPVEAMDKAKTTPLHLASKFGHEKMVNLLLKWDASASQRDSEGYNCLDLAIEQSNEDCAIAIINSDQWEEALRNEKVDTETLKRDTPMRKLIRKMPGWHRRINGHGSGLSFYKLVPILLKE